MNRYEKFDELSKEIINYLLHKIGNAVQDGTLEDENDCLAMYIDIITNIIMFPIKFHNGKEYTKQEILKHVKEIFDAVYKLVENKEHKKLH